MTFDPTAVEVTCVTLPKDHCVQVPWEYIKVCGYSDLFLKKNLNQRSLTPRWPLTPHLLRSYVWLYPRIIVSKSHENTSKFKVCGYSDPFCKNLNQRSLTPRWPLTPHLFRLFPAVAKWLDWFSVGLAIRRMLKIRVQKVEQNVTEFVTSPRFLLACHPSCQVVMSHSPNAVLYRDNNRLLRD